MKRIFGSHPAMYAFLLGGGAFLMVYAGYNLWTPDKSVQIREMDTDLVIASSWGLFGLGALLWLAGGVIFGRNRGINGLVALLIHLLPVLGLIVMTIMRRPLTPHEAWARDNPGLDTAESRRTYRPMKPLY